MALFGIGNKKKIEELKHHLEKEEFDKAALVADQIPIHKLKTPQEINLVGRAYKKNNDFFQAKEAFERSYALRCARTVLLDILDCCLEIKDLDAAEHYFDEYQKVSPEDRVTLYVYRYRIEKKKGRERKLLITILEELKALEYMEEYAYELAKQYHKAGMEKECMNECNDIILWFGFGATVERAKALLAYYRGEISLEEIKQAGVRYQDEQQKQREEVRAQLAKEAETIEEEAVAEEEIEAEAEIEEPEEAESAQEEVKAEKVIFESVEQEPEEDSEEEEEVAPEMEFLPEIDLSGLGLEEIQTEVKKEEPAVKVYEPDLTNVFVTETENEKLAELLRIKKISLPEILKNFGRMDRIRKQVIKSLELVLSDRENAYFVITGEDKTGKTTLAHYMVKLLYELEIVRYDRTATLDARQLNQVSLEDYGEELKNCNLIIENAGGMTKESIDGLVRFSKGCKGKNCVILEDSIRDINKFLRAREELNRLFNNRIHLGKYSVEELTGFVYDYIKKEDYSIDDTAIPVLKNKIDEIVRNNGNDQRLAKTLELAGAILARAEKRTGEIILNMATAGKIQTGNYLMILPQDIE